MRRIWGLGGICLLLMSAGLVLAVPAWAQAPDTDIETEMYRIADQLNCPLCQGQRLSECPLVVCEEMRAEITQWLQEGRSDSEIIQAFVDRYGIQVLNQPPNEGFHRLAWYIPFVGLAVVLAVGGWALRNWLRRPVDETGPDTLAATEPLPEEYLRRLEEDLSESP